MTADESDAPRLFRGSELSRLLLLAALMVAGWAYVWYYARSPRVVGEPAPVVEGPPAPIETDRSPEFETVKDKQPLSFRDSAAYAKLLKQADAATPDALAARSRRDVSFAQLWGDPARHRGVPVHLLGNARRVLRYESKLSRSGWLYEAWVFTPDGQKNPLVCVFEDAPRGLPIGPDVSERVVFNGYFLKLLAYDAGDTRRAAPLLVGRIGWTPSPGAAGTERPPAFWLAAVVGLVFLVSLGRFALRLRRSLSPRGRSSSLLLRNRPTEEIDPDDLNDWLERVGDEPDDAPTPTRHTP